MNRTRNLIANATTSVPREFNNWRNSLASAISPSSCPSSSSTASTPDRSPAISNPPWPKRASTSGHSSHPWRFKKRKEDSKKPKPGKIVTKQICLIDGPPGEHNDNELIPDYTLWDDMILVKGYCDFSTSYTESEIQKEISETLEQRFPLITPKFFDFVKRERNTITTPVVKNSHKWDFQQVKELCGQGKLYVRLNVDAEALEVSKEPVVEENIGTTVNQRKNFSSSTAETNSSILRIIPVIQHLLPVHLVVLREIAEMHMILSK